MKALVTAKGGPLPDFLVIGAQRAGTTWLDHALRAHPEVFLPTRRKEVHFFDQHYGRGVEWYASFFRAARSWPTAPRVGEITPRYLYDPKVPARIHALLPDCRLIAVLREPVGRLYSHYGLHIRDYGERRPFMRFAAEHDEAFARGLYSEQLERYLAHFPSRQILILLFEEVMAEPHTALEKLATFLEIDRAPFRRTEVGGAVNAAYRPRFPRARALARRLGGYLRAHDADAVVNLAKRIGVPAAFGRRGALPPIDGAARAQLAARYAADRVRLEALIGRRLALWTSEPATAAEDDLPGAT